MIGDKAAFQLPCEINVNTSTGPKIFEVLSELGSGGYNHAYLAYDKSAPDKHFVLKVYISGKESDNREAQILGMIRNRAINAPIVNILDPKVSTHNFQGHVEGLAKGKKILNQSPSARQALELALRFAVLLKTCAEAKVAYRDIKPSDHIFWEPKSDGDAVESMTVIDWNIAEYPAQPDALYYDLTKFCKRLPEFFMGKPPENGDYYHPLAWSFNPTMQARISRSMWLILVNLSMDFAAPIIYNGEKLLSLTLLSHESIVDAWDKVIQRLNDALTFLDAAEFPDLGFGGLDEYQIYLKEFVNEPDITKIKQWTNDLVYNWIGVIGIQTPVSYIKPDDDVLMHLCMARALNPGEFRESILLSCFVAVYRTGLFNDQASSPIYRKILQGLSELKSPEMIYDKKDFDELIAATRQKAAQGDWQAAGKICAEIWENLSTEFGIWIACEEFQRLTGIGEKEKFARSLDRFHPVVSFHLQNLEADKRINEQKSGIEKALEESQFEYAVLLAEKVRTSDSAAADEYLATIDVCKQLKNLGKEDRDNPAFIAQLIHDIGDRQLPRNFTEQTKELMERLPVLKNMASLQNDIEQADNLEAIDAIYRQIAILEENIAVQDFPIDRLKQACAMKFLKIKAKILTPLKNELDKLSRDRSISKLREISNELSKMSKVSQEWGATALEQECEKEKRHIDFDIAEINQEINRKIEGYKNEYNELLESAGASTEDYLLILKKLELIDAEKDIFQDDFRIWLANAQEKTNIFLSAADVLKNFYQNEQAEANLSAIIDNLNNYPDGKKLQQAIKDFRNKYDLRYKTANDIKKLTDDQSRSLSDLAKQVTDVTATIDDKVEPVLAEMKGQAEGSRTQLITLETELKKVASLADTAQQNIVGGINPALNAIKTQVNTTHTIVNEIKANRESIGGDIVAIRDQIKRIESRQMRLYIPIIAGLIIIICLLASALLIVINHFGIPGFNATPTTASVQTVTVTSTATATLTSTPTITETPTITATFDPSQPTFTVTPTLQITPTDTTANHTHLPYLLHKGARLLSSPDSNTNLWDMVYADNVEVSVLGEQDGTSDKKKYSLIELKIAIPLVNLKDDKVAVGAIIKVKMLAGINNIGEAKSNFNIQNNLTKEGEPAEDGLQWFTFKGWVLSEKLEKKP